MNESRSVVHLPIELYISAYYSLKTTRLTHQVYTYEAVTVIKIFNRSNALYILFLPADCGLFGKGTKQGTNGGGLRDVGRGVEDALGRVRHKLSKPVAEGTK